LKRLHILFFILLYIASLTATAETVRLTNGEWSPYLSKDLKHFGVTSHIIEEAFKNVGVDVEYGFFPWKRSFAYAAIGKSWEGTVVWSRTPERERFFLFSEPVLKAKEVFFHRKDMAFDWDNYGQLGQYQIGGVIGYSYGDDMDNAEKTGKLKVHRVVKALNNFKKLLTGRIDLVVANIDVGYELLYKNFPPAQAALITNHPKSSKTGFYHLLISKKSPNAQATIHEFNKGLAELKASGKYAQMMSNSLEGYYKKTN